MENFSSSEELLYYCSRDKKQLIDFFKNTSLLSEEIQKKVEILEKNAHLIPKALDFERKKLEKIEHIIREISSSLEELKYSIENKALRVFNHNDLETFSKPIKNTLKELIEIQKKLQNDIEENIVFLELIKSYLEKTQNSSPSD